MKSSMIGYDAMLARLGENGAMWNTSKTEFIFSCENNKYLVQIYLEKHNQTTSLKEPEPCSQITLHPLSTLSRRAC